MIDQKSPLVRRASATPEELAARQQHVSKHPVQRLTTPPQYQRPRKTVEDKRIGATPASQIKYRPLNREFIIPMSDGSELRVTERDLSSMPQEYKDAAMPVSPIPQTSADIPALPQRRGDIPYPYSTRHPLRAFFIRVFFVASIGFIIMLVGWMLFTALSGWIQEKRNDFVYGKPRSYQVDYNVGHGTPDHPLSHFIALNLNRHIEVIEIPGNNPGKSEIIVGPTLIGEGQDLTPVTLSFEGGEPGHPDLVIHIEDTRVIFLNKQVNGVWKFVAAANQ